jgi:hypothetical protein
MRILRLEAENIKKLKVIDITPKNKPGVIMVTGKNGQGKTSTLDTILYTLGGTEDLPSQPIRKGADKGFSRIDLGDCWAVRKYTPTGSELILESKDGARYKKPQGKLDDWFGKLFFDPLAFTRMKPDEQMKQLRSLVRLEIDPEEIKIANKADYDLRRNITREAKELQAQVNFISVVAELPEKPIDISAKITELEEAGKLNASIATIEAEAKRGYEFAKEQNEAAKRLREEAANMIETARAKEASADERVKQTDAIEIPKPIDTAALREEIENARAVNAQLDKKARKDELQAQLTTKEAQADKLTADMEARDKQLADAVLACEMPIDGLTFKDGEVVYQDFPLDQASGAEQLRVSLAVAMAGNPEGRVILVKDGSLLDEDSMEVVNQMAIEKDFQIWIEAVDNSGKIGIVLQDGIVASTNDVEEEPKPGELRNSEKVMKEAKGLRMSPPDGPSQVVRVRTDEKGQKTETVVDREAIEASRETLKTTVPRKPIKQVIAENKDKFSKL